MNKVHWVRVAVLVTLVLAAFSLRLIRLDVQDIWWDEARNIDVAARPLAQIATAPELDIHPPLYFYLLHGWLALSADTPVTGADAFAARFLSLWFGVLLAPLLYALGRRCGGPWVGLGAAAAAAASPFLLGEAQETRMYTMTLALLCSAALALISAVQPGARAAGRGWRNWLEWGLFALFSALALLTHYAAAFGLAALWGWAAAWTLAGRGRAFGARMLRLGGAALAAALIALPGLPVALRQIPTYRNPNLEVPSVAAYLAELGRVFGLGDHIAPAAALPWQVLLAALLIAGWLLAVVRRPPDRTRGLGGSLALAWALAPLVIYYLVISDRATFATRYISVALPGWLLLVGWAVDGWARLRASPPPRPASHLSRFTLQVSRFTSHASRLASHASRLTSHVSHLAAPLALLGITIALVPGLRGDLTDERFFREDTRGLAAWLAAEADPRNDLILVDQRYPFGFYYQRWNNQHDGLPPPEPAALAPSQYLFVDINTLAARLNTLARGRQRVYWVRWFESDTDPRGAVPFLLEKFGTLLGQRAFRGYAVSWYAISPDPGFELSPALGGVAADFADQVRLTGYAFGGRGAGLVSSVAETRLPSAPADQGIWVTVRWSALPGAAAADPNQPRGLKASVVLEDSGGRVVGRDDRPILNDRHLAPDQWARGDAPLGVHLVRPEPAIVPGAYTLKLAVYDPVTLQQLPLSGAAEHGPFLRLGQVTLVRATRWPAASELPIRETIDFNWQGLRLLGRGSLPEQARPGDEVTFDLYWRAEAGDLPDLQARFSLRPGTGATWVTPLAGGYATGEWAAGETLRDHQRLRLDPALAEGVYTVELSLLDPAAADASPSVVLGQLAVAGRPHVFELPADVGARSGATIGNFARLLGFRWAVDRQPGKEGALELELVWQAAGPAAQAYTVSVQLLADGVLAAQHDQSPGGGAFPTTSWVAGEVLTDAYRVRLPAALAPGSYALVVKMYDPATGIVLPVTAADGRPAGDLLLLSEIDIK